MFHHVGLNVIEAKEIYREVCVRSMKLDRSVMDAMNAAESVGSENLPVGRL